jgi:hypothetical protein
VPCNVAQPHIAQCERDSGFVTCQLLVEGLTRKHAWPDSLSLRRQPLNGSHGKRWTREGSWSFEWKLACR